MMFTKRLPVSHIGLLNFRARAAAGDCPHCGCRSALKSHGYLYGYAATGDAADTRGLRFFLL